MKLKAGDRVAVYGFVPSSLGSSNYRFSRNDRGVVDSIVSDNELIVKFDSGEVGEVHPKQCRRLKKKAKVSPDQIWVNFPKCPLTVAEVFNDQSCAEYYAQTSQIEYQEVAVPFVRVKK